MIETDYTITLTTDQRNAVISALLGLLGDLEQELVCPTTASIEWRLNDAREYADARAAYDAILPARPYRPPERINGVVNLLAKERR